MSRFLATDRGVRVQLTDAELAIVARLGSLLGGAGVEKDDPAAKRLKPVIYKDDPAASREFERLAAKERVEARSSDRERFVNGLRSAAANSLVLSEEEAGVWVRVIGEARIVLAARKGYFEDGLPSDVAEDPEAALVMFLGILQEELVGEMLTVMKEAP